MSRGSEMGLRSLGRQLKALRVACGKSIEDVRAIGSRDKIWRMETGKGPYKFADVQSLCLMYGADQATVLRLTELAAKLNSDKMFEDYTDVLPSWFATYYELESAASKVLAFDPDVVPGLLQTADYAQALFMANARPLPANTMERLIVSRGLRLQNVLTGTPNGQIHAVVGEGALLRQVGGLEVASAQLAYLRELDATEAVEISVLTWDSGAHAAMDGAFWLLQFADGDEQDVAFVNNNLGGRYYEKWEQVERFTEIFASVAHQSIPLEEYKP